MTCLKLTNKYFGKQDRLPHTSKFEIKQMSDGTFKIWVDDANRTARFDLTEENRIRLIEFLQCNVK